MSASPQFGHSRRGPSPAEAIAQAAPGVVSVRAGRTRLSGLRARDGLVVTAEEPLPEEGPFEVVLHGGERRGAVEVGRDPSTDVALLRIEGDAPPPGPLAVAPDHADGPGTSVEADDASASVRAEDTAGSSQAVGPGTAARAGDPALLIAARDGLPLVAAGIVSFAGPAWRSLRGGAIDARIELDLLLPADGEGGLALGAEDAALGMAVLGPRGRTLVIPAATIARVVPQLEAKGRIARGYVGLGLRPVEIDGGGRGLLVVNVAEGGPGARAGIVQGDVVTELDGEAVRGMRGLMRSLGPERVGTEARLGFRRAGEPREAVVAIAERPAG